MKTILADVQLHQILVRYFMLRFQCKEMGLVKENEKKYLFMPLDAFHVVSYK